LHSVTTEIKDITR